MREIIYRCWDSRNKEFAYSNEHNDYAKFVFENGTLVCYFGEDYGEDFRWVKSENTPEADTGLKDKNGDRIFENDKVIYDMDEFGYIGFCGGQFCFVSYDDGFQSGLLWEDASDEFEIIGNIHDVNKEKVIGDE